MWFYEKLLAYNTTINILSSIASIPQACTWDVDYSLMCMARSVINWSNCLFVVVAAKDSLAMLETKSNPTMLQYIDFLWKKAIRPSNKACILQPYKNHCSVFQLASYGIFQAGSIRFHKIAYTSWITWTIEHTWLCPKYCYRVICYSLMHM